MSRQVSYVKGQYNRPRDRDGGLVSVLLPADGYSVQELLQQKKKVGWKGTAFPDQDDPNNFPYWDIYLTAENGPLTYISVFGEVACCYNKKAENQTYRVMQQQWDLQHVPSDFDLTTSEMEEAIALDIHPDTAILEKIKKRQKYLSINLNINPHYKDTHGTVRLHNMVGLVHSPICLDDVWWDEKIKLYRLKGSLNWDHLDKDKTNNSVYNLNGTTAIRNKVMVDWSIEQKRQFFKDAEKLPKENRDKIIIKQ